MYDLHQLRRNQKLLEVFDVGVLRSKLGMKGFEANEPRLTSSGYRIGLVGRPSVKIES